MNKTIINTLARIAKKTGYTGEVTKENFNAIVKTLVEVYPEDFARELHAITEKAIQSWELYNNSQGRIRDNSDKYYNTVDSLVEPLNMITDRGVGLYPTYEVTINGRKYTEYTSLNAMRRFNNFWNNND